MAISENINNLEKDKFVEDQAGKTAVRVSFTDPIAITTTAQNTTFTPDGDIESNNVQDAIVEVRDEVNAKIQVVFDAKRKYLTTGIWGDEPIFTDNGDGSGGFSAFEILLRSSADGLTPADKYSIGASGPFFFTDNGSEMVYVDYNGGYPFVSFTSNHLNLNLHTKVPFYKVWRVGNICHSLSYDAAGIALSEKLAKSIKETDTYKRAGNVGLIVSETTNPNTRTINITPATVYSGPFAIQVGGFNSSTSNMIKLTVTNGTWAYSNQELVYDNLQYNPSTGPVNATANKFLTRFFYRSIGDVVETFYVLGSIAHTKYADAINEQPRTDLPLMIREHCLLVGRSVIEYNTTSGITESAFGLTFTGSQVITHNDTANLNTGDYLHLTAIQFTALWTKITNGVQYIGKVLMGDVTNGNYSEIESDGTLKFNGAARVWRDLIISPSSTTGGAAAPSSRPYNGSSVIITTDAFSGISDNDVVGSIEMQHDYAEGTAWEVHVHFTPEIAMTAGQTVTFKLDYDICGMGSGTHTTGTSSGTYTSPVGGTPAWTHIYLDIAAISGTNRKIGDILSFCLTRMASTDSYSGATAFAHLLSIGAHYECDTVGSREETTK